MNKICIVYTHHKLGDLIWQLPYIKAISQHHQTNIDLVVREKTQAQNILKDLKHINQIFYNDFRKGLLYWVDLKLNYSERSQKLLKINSINVENKYPNLEIDVESLKKNNSDLLVDGKKIAFGVDSFEDYKMWYEEDFIKLADLLFEKKLFNYIYLVCSPEKSHIAKKIITESNKDYFIDCSNKDLQGVILAIKNSDFFLGNNSGPLNLAAALGIKSFGLIANDPVSELKYSKIIPIVPKDYVDNVWHRYRNGMKNLKPDEVFNQVIENL